jgi:hypothetical protein
MRHTPALTILMLIATSSVAGAQTPANPMHASLKATFDTVAGYLAKTAEKVPEDVYSFKPISASEPSLNLLRVAEYTAPACLNEKRSEPRRFSRRRRAVIALPSAECRKGRTSC